MTVATLTFRSLGLPILLIGALAIAPFAIRELASKQSLEDEWDDIRFERMPWE